MGIHTEGHLYCGLRPTSFQANRTSAAKSCTDRYQINKTARAGSECVKTLESEAVWKDASAIRGVYVRVLRHLTQQATASLKKASGPWSRCGIIMFGGPQRTIGRTFGAHGASVGVLLFRRVLQFGPLTKGNGVDIV